MRRGFRRNFAPIKILADHQIEAIHRATLDVLETTGVKFESERALRILKKEGCVVNYETKVVKIPSSLVEECIRRTPSSFFVKSRNSKDDLRIGGNTLYFYSSVGARLFDISIERVRKPSFEENNDSVIISDALETMDFFDSYCPYFEIEDIEPVMLCPVSLASRIRYTTKVSRGAQAAESYIWEIQLAHAAKQQIVGCMESSPPLTYSEDAINAGFAYSNVGFPIFIASGSVMGGTSPVTISGSTVSNNAELLAAVVFLQCVKPGLGIIANDFVNAMNMQSGNIYFCSLNASLHQMAFNQMWTQYYKIPTVNTGAAYPNSKLVDYQGAYEKTHIAMTSALSGANVIVLHGGVTAELSYSPIVAIIDDDIANIVGKTIEGFEVNDNTMALDMIQKVGPVPGTFLSTNHTRLHWKQESFIPKVADRLSYQEWLSNNKINVIDKAKLRMEKILATHVPEPIDSSLDREIEKILADARKYYKEKGLM